MLLMIGIATSAMTTLLLLGMMRVGAEAAERHEASLPSTRAEQGVFKGA